MKEFSEQEHALARRFATAIVDRRMAMPATLFLEGMRPMNFVGSQFLHFFNPMLGVVFDYRELESLAAFLEKRESLELLVSEIEGLEEIRLEKEREEKRRRTEERQRLREGRARPWWWPFAFVLVCVLSPFATAMADVKAETTTAGAGSWTLDRSTGLPSWMKFRGMAGPPLTLKERKATFERLMIELQSRYPAPARGRAASWPAAARDVRRRALGARTDPEFFLALRRLIALPGDPRARMLTPQGEPIVGWPPGLTLGSNDSEILIARVEQPSEAARLGIVAGSRLVTIDGRPAEERSKEVQALLSMTEGISEEAALIRARRSVLIGPPDQPVRITSMGPGGKTTEATLPREPVPSHSPAAGEEEAFAIASAAACCGARFQKAEAKIVLPEPSEATGGVAYVKVPQLSPFPAAILEIDQAMERIVTRPGGTAGLVLDLRGAGGDGEEAMLRLAGRFFLAGTEIGEVRVNGPRGGGDGEARRALVADFRPDRYSGSVVVLIDAETSSLAELLAQALKTSGKAKLVGERTAGATRLMENVRLPSRVLVELASGARLSAGGESLEGIGVDPDVHAAQTAEDASAGRDTVLESALRLLASEPASSSPR